MLEYYQVIANRIKPLTPEPQLTDFIHPSISQKNFELLFASVDTGVTTYALCKYFKQMADEKLKVLYYQPDHLWSDYKATKELHETTSLPKKDVKSWFIYHPLRK